MEITLGNKKCFEFKYCGNGLSIKRKKELGRVYNLNEKLSINELDAVLALQAKTPSQIYYYRTFTIRFAILNSKKRISE